MQSARQFSLLDRGENDCGCVWVEANRGQKEIGIKGGKKRGKINNSEHDENRGGT